MTELPPRSGSLLANRDFAVYWAGVIASQIGTRAATAATYYQVFQLTGSIAYTGLLGAAQALALLVLSPLGGAFADRLDRRRLLQVTQASALLVAAALAVLTLSGHVEAWQVVAAAALTTATATFDQPARQALIPAMVPREQIASAVALLNPSRELAVLVGPAVGGLLIAAAGPGLVYAFDAVTYALLVALLATVRTGRLTPTTAPRSVWSSIVEGARYVRGKSLITHLIGLDLSATLFSAYRVLLPALALDVLHTGPAGYGALASAPSVGALAVTYIVVRTVRRSRRQGRVLLAVTGAYGGAAVLLAHAGTLPAALGAAVLLGGCDAMATSIRQAAIQIDTPDALRGRVTAFYQMASRGGPAAGDALMGSAAAAIGPALALSAGALVPIAVAVSLSFRDNAVRRYTGTA